MNKKSAFNLPNCISVFRLLLVPVFVFFFFLDAKWGQLAAGIVFVVAAVSDSVDGYIARKYDLITNLGHVLDPLADKCMQCTAAVCLGIAEIVPYWVAAFLIVKELLLLLGGAVLFRRYTDCIPSNAFGKGASFLFFMLIAFYVLFPDVFREGAPWLFLAAVAVSLAALIVYTVSGIRILRTDTLPSAQSVRRRSAAPQNDSEVN